MSNRIQSLRSSTPGSAPAAGAFLPGELWTNFPDLQFGVVDNSNNAQKLIAVRYFSATANYVSGDFVVQGGKIYCAKSSVPAGAFNATQWDQVTTAATLSTTLSTYLPLSGGTLTGALTMGAGAALTLSGPPALASQAATKAYVDGAGLPVAGGTLTGDLTIAPASDGPDLILNKPTAAAYSAVRGQNAGNGRWDVILGDNTAESGSNAGSNFYIGSYADNGAGLSTPLVIQRASGYVYLNGNGATPTAFLAGPYGYAALFLNKAGSGVHCQINGQNNGLNRWQMVLGSSTVEGGSNTGSDFLLNRFNDAGAVIDTPLTITRSTGSTLVTRLVAGASPPSNVTSGIHNAGGFWSSATAVTAFMGNMYFDGANYRAFVAGGAGLLQFNGSGTAQWAFYGNAGAAAGGVVSPAVLLSVDQNGNVLATGAVTCNAQAVVRNASQPNVNYQTAAGASLGQTYYQVSTAQMGLFHQSSGASAFINGSGQFQTPVHYNTTANAYMAGGTLWQNTSDARIKTILGEYTFGLDQILKLKPVRFRYKANDTLDERLDQPSL